MSVDAISLAVFRSLFESVSDEMGVTLQRAAFSPNIRERLDFSCAIFDVQARMIAQSAHIPVHLGSMPASVESAIRSFSTFAPGDTIILNDPYHGGTHLPDVTMVSPVFAEKTLEYFVASRAHHADVGGMSPGSLPLSTELYQEGLIIPPVKLVEAGVRNEALLSLIVANSRAPGERLGDYEAQFAAQRVGAARLTDLIATHGKVLLKEHAEALLAYSRRMTEATITAIPNGVYTFKDILEGDGQSEYPIPIHVKVTVRDRLMTVDFQGSAPQVTGNINAVPAIVRSATWYCIRLLSGEDLPLNYGCFEPIKVITPPHSVLDPDFPAAVAIGNTETGQRIVDVVLGALSQAMPERIPAASQGTMNNVTIGGIWQEQPFIYYETIGGGHGANKSGTGVSGRHSHMTNTRNTPIEALEYTLPFRVREYALRDSSGGEGEYRGGDGIRRVYEFLSTATTTLNTERRRSQPYGSAGGLAGESGRNTLVRDGEEVNLGSKWTGSVWDGDLLIVETPGGGGYGLP